MPQVIFALAALDNLERLREFLRPRNSAAAKRAAVAITKTVQLLGQHPQIGRPAEEMDIEYRELPIDFGDGGHVALYRYEGDFVTVLSLRHPKEAGYELARPLNRTPLSGDST